MLAFDIETGPVDQSVLDQLMPEFDDSKFQPTVFDESQVKTGNLVDPQKVKAKIEEARQKHAAEQKQLGNRAKAAELAHRQLFVDRAALQATTGRVLAIGMETAEGYHLIDNDDEAKLLAEFFAIADQAETVVGFNSNHFDLPFLLRRAMILRVNYPADWIGVRGYFLHRFVDLLDVWRMGNRQEWIKLDELARVFGIGQKTEGVSGADFANLWASDRKKAEQYLRNDVLLTYELAVEMGI